MAAPSDMTGLRFGRLVGLKREGSVDGRAAWSWQCDCGTVKRATGDSVRRGLIVSCGCYQQECRTKHGCWGTPTYMAWQNMKARAAGNGERNQRYYAARGIVVCERWNSFDNFLADMGECPPGLTLERDDNDKGYGPGNCHWATWSEQANNRRARGSVVGAVL